MRLMNFSNFPRPDVIILDEAGSAESDFVAKIRDPVGITSEGGSISGGPRLTAKFPARLRICNNCSVSINKPERQKDTTRIQMERVRYVSIRQKSISSRIMDHRNNHGSPILK